MIADSLCFVCIGFYSSWKTFLIIWCDNTNFKTSQAKTPHPKRRSDVFVPKPIYEWPLSLEVSVDIYFNCFHYILTSFDYTNLKSLQNVLDYDFIFDDLVHWDNYLTFIKDHLKSENVELKQVGSMRSFCANCTWKVLRFIKSHLNSVDVQMIKEKFCSF